MEENARVLLASLAVFLLVMAASVLLLRPGEMAGRLLFEEEGLVKEKALAIAPGEAYVYEYSASGSNATASFAYRTGSGRGCTVIELGNAQNRASVCLDSGGNDGSGGNVTLAEPNFYVFAPWMLAVRNNWTWGATLYAEAAGGRTRVGSVRFSGAGNETVYGREAHKIAVFVEERKRNSTIYKWIDEEKRVLLREAGEGYELAIVSAPFSLGPRVE